MRRRCLRDRRNRLRASLSRSHYFAVHVKRLSAHRVLAMVAILGCASRPATTPTTSATTASPVVRPGLDAFVANPPGWARGKRIGLITNVAGIDSRGSYNFDLLAGGTRVRLSTLFAFEH
jgi:uncharacterized protein YbbC (DUF1343 family)